MRNSDPDAAVYWLARMLEAGEDPLYVARRLVRFASEDIGNADPRALQIALAAKDAVHFLGMPEGNTALAQAAIYLATAPKSNAVYRGYRRAAARRAPRTSRSRCRCICATRRRKLMKELDYGKGYRYAHDEAEGVAAMACLPEHLEGRRTTSRPIADWRRRSKRRWNGRAICGSAATRENGARRAPQIRSKLRSISRLVSRSTDGPAVRTDRRVRRATKLVQQILHLLARQGIVGLHRRMARHRRAICRNASSTPRPGREPFEVGCHGPERGLASLPAENRRHGAQP